MGQLLSPPAGSVSPLSAQRAEAVAYIVCSILIEAGYFINISKSQCVPSTVVRFLGSFALSSLVNLKTLQRFAGKIVSFGLAIPG